MRTFKEMLQGDEETLVGGAMVVLARRGLTQDELVAVVQGLLTVGYRCGRRETAADLEATMEDVRKALKGGSDDGG